MTELIPEGFTFATDISAADWIVGRLKPWGRDRVRLWSFLPDVFDRYARILHPPFHESRVPSRARWSDLAARNNVALGPSTSFREVSGLDPTDQQDWYQAKPVEGTLDRTEISALSHLLASFTAEPDRCWLAVWSGWGSWRPGSRSTLTATSTPIGSPNKDSKDDAQPPRDLQEIRTQHREYYLLSSSLELIPSFAILGWHQAPSIWWPEDGTWCVVTEVDGYSSYVGGSSRCIDAVIASSLLEAISVPPDVPMDSGPY